MLGVVLFPLRFILIFLVIIYRLIFELIPSMFFGISPLFLMPIGIVSGLLMRRPSIEKQIIVTFRFTTAFLIVIVPVVLFLYVCELIGGIYFIWMLAYLVIRFYNGAHEKEVILRYGFKRLEALNEQFQTYYMENNPLIGIVIIALTIASLVAGYLVGGEGGLWCGAVIAIIIVALGQHQYKLRK